MRSRTPCMLLVFLGALLLVLPAAAVPASVPHTIEIRQAHLAWSALETEVAMNAAVTYCSTLYGADTSNMSRILTEFKAQESLVTGTASAGDLDALIDGMRNTTSRFRAEMLGVMTKGQGDWTQLQRGIDTAQADNPYIVLKKDAYWQVRKTDQLADFDTWVKEGQQALDRLKTAGYDTATAQRALDVFVAHRPDVAEALGKKTGIAVEAADRQVAPLSEQFVKELAAAQAQVPDSVRFAFFVDQGYRAVGEADRANYALVPILLDLGDADSALSRAKVDLLSAKKILGTGNLASARTPLRLVQEDFSSLAQAYREVKHRAVLPDDLSAEMDSLALRLDEIAGQMGEVL